MDDSQPLAALPEALRAKVVSSLTVTLSTVLSEPAELPGVQQYGAQFALHHRLRTRHAAKRAANQPPAPTTEPGPDDVTMLAWALTHGVTPANGTLTVPIGGAGLVTADMSVHGVSGEVDMLSHDYGLLSSALAYGDGDTVPPAWDTVTHSGPLALLLGGIHLDGPFRGHQLGLRATIMLLEHFGSSCSAAVLYPGDANLEPGPAKEAAHHKLADYWSHLGFTPYDDGVMLLELTDASDLWNGILLPGS